MPRSFVTHLECSATGERHEAGVLHNLSRAGKPLLVRYDLAAAKQSMTREALRDRPAELWRYRELLPVQHDENIVSLGEVMTPLVRIASETGEVLIKDEGRLPTGSFKARGVALAVSMAKELGVTRVAMPTNGNAGAAWAAYAARAGMRSLIAMPVDAPVITRAECAIAGAELYLVD
ncbi:MAG TPA: pyridoxal-phosphate dependent enzyme, partial [Rhizomicrobium sp.]